MIIGKYPSLRLRRNRKESWSRRLIQENTLSPNDFILPIFLIEGSNKRQEISSMPGVYRYTINRLSQIVDKAIKLAIPMIAILCWRFSFTKLFRAELSCPLPPSITIS